MLITILEATILDGLGSVRHIEAKDNEQLFYDENTGNVVLFKNNKRETFFSRYVISIVSIATK